MNLKLRYNIIIIDLSLKNPKIQELHPLVSVNIRLNPIFSGQILSLKIPTIQELPRGLCPPGPPTRALPSWSPYQGIALDPLGALSGPQTPRRNCLVPPTF
jgi:hypothetical protein